VRAFNGAGNSAFSNIATATTLAGPPTPVAAVSPATLTFSSQLNVPSAAQTVTVSNTGTAALTINSIAVGGADAGQFSVALNGAAGRCGLTYPRTLNAGQNCTVSVTFTPNLATPVNKSAALNVTVAAPATSQTVTLSGTVVAAPQVPAGAVLWLKADAGVTLTGGAVSAWADQSGNNRNAAQGSGNANSRPTVVSNALNGLPVLNFNGTSNFMTFSFGPNGLGGGAAADRGMTLILVSSNTSNRTPGASRAENAAIFWNETAAWGTVYLAPFQNNVRYRFGTGQVNNWPLLNRTSIGTAYSTSIATKNGATLTDTLHVNGALAFSETGKINPIANTVATGQIGRGYNNNSFFPGRIAEVLVYGRALSTADRQAVEAYLQARYLLP
jgi:hypothetical protein